MRWSASLNTKHDATDQSHTTLGTLVKYNSTLRKSNRCITEHGRTLHNNAFPQVSDPKVPISALWHECWTQYL